MKTLQRLYRACPVIAALVVYATIALILFGAVPLNPSSVSVLGMGIFWWGISAVQAENRLPGNKKRWVIALSFFGFMLTLLFLFILTHGHEHHETMSNYALVAVVMVFFVSQPLEEWLFAAQAHQRREGSKYRKRAERYHELAKDPRLATQHHFHLLRGDIETGNLPLESLNKLIYHAERLLESDDQIRSALQQKQEAAQTRDYSVTALREHAKRLAGE